MNLQLPKYNFLYYKNILDVCFSRFCSDFNSDFIKDNDIYVYANHKSKTQLKNIFKQYIKEELQKIVKPYQIVGTNYYFIIGSCMPNDNILLKFKDSYFPEKLNRVLSAPHQIKYVLKEKDIKIDLVYFNAIFIEIFNEMFTKHLKVLRLFGDAYKNIFMLQHNRLDCLTMYKTCRYLYGRNNTINLFKQHFADKRVNIYSINECIDKYIHNKKALNQSDEFKLIVTEVKQYISECIKSISNG